MALENIINVRLQSAGQPKNIVTQSSLCKYINYKPSRLNYSGPNSRQIKLFNKHIDPLEPSKWKHKKVPVVSDSDKVPALHPPPRVVTAEDHKDWNIPPCISNWKNPKGYTIPLDKRLGVDGRVLEEVRVSEKFMIMPEALYAAEKKMREEVELRAKVDKEMKLKEQQRDQEKLCALAKIARLEQGKMKREVKLTEKDVVMGKKSRVAKERDHDVSEKIALGIASTGGRGEAIMYDARLFNQDKGMGSGFANDDQYNVYDKGLFAAQSTLSTLHRPKQDVDLDAYGGAADEQLDRIMKTDRFKPDVPLAGTSIRSGPREIRPVEVAKELDLFGLNQFYTEIEKGAGNLGSSGIRTSGCSSMPDGYRSGSSSSHSTPVLA